MWTVIFFIAAIVTLVFFIALVDNESDKVDLKALILGMISLVSSIAFFTIVIFNTTH